MTEGETTFVSHDQPRFVSRRLFESLLRATSFVSHEAGLTTGFRGTSFVSHEVAGAGSTVISYTGRFPRPAGFTQTSAPAFTSAEMYRSMVLGVLFARAARQSRPGHPRRVS